MSQEALTGIASFIEPKGVLPAATLSIKAFGYTLDTKVTGGVFGVGASAHAGASNGGFGAGAKVIFGLFGGGGSVDVRPTPQ